LSCRCRAPPPRPVPPSSDSYIEGKLRNEPGFAMSLLDRAHMCELALGKSLQERVTELSCLVRCCGGTFYRGRPHARLLKWGAAGEGGPVLATNKHTPLNLGPVDYGDCRGR
jgi:hypothetical protein